MALLPFCMHEGMCWPRGFKRREARAVALLVAKKKKKKIKHRISNSTNNHFEDNIHFRRETIKRVWYRGYQFKPGKRKTKTSLSEIKNK